MDFINGKYNIFSIKVNGEYYPIGCLTDSSFNETTELLPTKVRTNPQGFNSFVGTTQEYVISVNGLVTEKSKESGILTYYDIQQLKRNKTVVSWKKSGGINLIEYGEGVITSLSNVNAIDEFISFSATIQGQGVPRSNPQIEGGLEYILQHKL